MTKRQNKSSVRNQALPKTGMALGAHGGAGVRDPNTLPKPTLPAWDGWKGVKRDE